MRFPDFTIPFDIETGALASAVGVVLKQVRHPIAFFNKKLGDKMRSKLAYVREMHVITKAVKKWRQYFICNHFRICTDQQSLWHMLNQSGAAEVDHQASRVLLRDNLQAWLPKSSCYCSLSVPRRTRSHPQDFLFPCSGLVCWPAKVVYIRSLMQEIYGAMLNWKWSQTSISCL